MATDKMNWDKALERYDSLVEECERFDRKGKSMIYTSANGYMFSLLNKDAEMGIRFSKEVQEKYIKEFNSDYYKSHGATMKGYIIITESMLKDRESVIDLLNESYDYVMSLDPK